MAVAEPGVEQKDSRPLFPAFDAVDAPQGALIDKCVHCGFCLPTCPTYLLWGEEMDSPRGRIYLMKAALEGRTAITPSFVQHFDACLGCMACVTACPSGVQYGPLVERTRAQIERHFPRSFADRAFRAALFSVLPYPRRLRVVLAPLVILGRTAKAFSRTSIFMRLPARLRALISLAPRVSWASLTGRAPERTAASGAKRLTVGLLTGCVQRLVFPHVNTATINVLAAEGCEVIAPADQGCCGALALHAGRIEEARAFARRLIATFEKSGVDRIIVNAAGCGSSMKEYGELLADDPAWSARAHAFSLRVRDVSEALVEVGEPRAVRQPVHARVVYHDACHLAHAQGVRAQPRDLLRAIPGLEVLSPAEQEICCGSAGIYNLVEPDAAAELGARKVRNIAALRPDVIATGNPGCLIQLASTAGLAGFSWPVVHPIELIAASIQGRDPGFGQRDGTGVAGAPATV
jgi:glycolate oxidase iron-sulfur subunit